MKHMPKKLRKIISPHTWVFIFLMDGQTRFNKIFRTLIIFKIISISRTKLYYTNLVLWFLRSYKMTYLTHYTLCILGWTEWNVSQDVVFTGQTLIFEFIILVKHAKNAPYSEINHLNLKFIRGWCPLNSGVQFTSTTQLISMGHNG